MLVEVPIWVNILANFGFPIVVAVYLLMRFENKISSLETSTQQLIEVIKNSRQ
ncbi:YvrJ family protein [Aneurinibacillus tyrosinisolvens]|jgi:hypothetical protein|uniref:YvrJ family protein n=1 Tax=Aneurinibacillus tyrosinisolvens TaxID=1443435 RepID=UPI0009E219AA|nr:YvrJ family protein [Aneurinibacillus tyrosinisolvens]